jgi:hypothetical protein
MDVQVHLSSNQCPASAVECALMHNVPYCETVSALNWATLATQPDITFTVSTVAHFAAKPSPAHIGNPALNFFYLYELVQAQKALKVAKKWQKPQSQQVT